MFLAGLESILLKFGYLLSSFHNIRVSDRGCVIVSSCLVTCCSLERL
jgi:hypothetical protein